MEIIDREVGFEVLNIFDSKDNIVFELIASAGLGDDNMLTIGRIALMLTRSNRADSNIINNMTIRRLLSLGSIMESIFFNKEIINNRNNFIKLYVLNLVFSMHHQLLILDLYTMVD